MTERRDSIAELSPERRLALERDLLARRVSRAGRPVIAPRRAEDPAPLSAPQRRLWFLDRLDPQSAVYNIHRVMRIRGPLDTAALAAALGDVWSRHDALRCSFPAAGGRPQVVVAPAGAFPLRRDVITSGPDADERLHALLDAEVSRPFDLAAGPLLRASLTHLGDDDHVLALTVHHIACDEWSMRLLAEELSACYGARSAGGAPSLPPLAIQYPDFALWQQQGLAQGRWSAQRDWWRDHLAGAPESAVVAGRTPSAAASRGTFGRRTWRVPDDVVAGLNRLGRETDATPFMVSLAAFLALLHRYGDGADVVVTTPVAGRPAPETERLIGFFANTLALRSAAGDDPTFRDHLRRVRATLLGALENQALPFDAVIDAVRPARAAGSAPLFDILFTHRDAIDPPLSHPALDVTAVEVRGGLAKSDLWLALVDGPDGRRATLGYDSAAFAAPAVARIAGHLDRLMTVAAADPDARLSALPLLGVAERQTLLAEWSGATGCRPVSETMTSLFAAVAAERPGATAVAGDDGTLDYRTLDRWSNRLAHRLRALGVTAGAVVGIAAPRGPALIAGLLAILKAGGAYLALDPSYPAARLRAMLETADAALVLATPGLLPEGIGVAVAGLDPAGAGLTREPADAPAATNRPDSLAYVAFTSGSTGEPKAIAVEHRGVVRLVHRADYLALGPDERILQMAPVAFDASTFEIWGALLNGACLVPASESPSLAQIAGVIAAQQVTTAWLTAGLFHRMVDHQVAALAGLRQLVAGGDVLSVDHVRRLRRAAPSLRLVNGYGPTETTTFACTFTVAAGAALEPSVPIGRPIGNTSVYVLDRTGQPAPIGVPGALSIGGAGVARGYLGRPDLTAERFVADPFAAAPGARLYRTGDRAMWREDGVLLFLGRTDRQVKIRGHRVEPAEVEAVLRALPVVREAAVIVTMDPAGERRLVAGCVLADGGAADAVASALRTRLPAHLLPSAIVALEALPLTPAGKLDTAALAARIGAPAVATGGEPPRDALEEWLAAIWRDVLRVETVGRDDDFFALGGHSLLAAELFAHIDDALDAPLPLATLFEAPTVAGLAAAIRAGRGGAAWPTAVPMARGAPGGHPVFAVPGIGGNIVGYSDLARCLGGDRPFVGLMARGLDGVSAPFDRVADIAADNVVQIRAIQPAGPYVILGACIGGVVAFEMAQQLRRAGETVAALALLDPAFRKPRVGAWRIRARYRFARAVDVPRFAARRARLYAADLGGLAPSQWPGYLRGKAAVIGGAATAARLPGAAQRELNQQRVIDAHRTALETYVPASYDGPIAIFRTGGRDWRASRRLLDWQALAPCGVAVETVAGRDSADALRPPHVEGFAARLRAVIERTP